ncbi:hypothetical protein KAI46_05225 [bacterium]|nr:hypothetical protein [bacterium]
MITPTTAAAAAQGTDPDDVCPTLPAARSEYGKCYEEALIKAHNWIRKNAACVAWLPDGLFNWIKEHDAQAYVDHVRLQSSMDDLIEKRAPIEQFNQVLALWGRHYCNLAREAHMAMILELNTELRADLKRDAARREKAA